MGLVLPHNPCPGVPPPPSINVGSLQHLVQCQGDPELLLRVGVLLLTIMTIMPRNHSGGTSRSTAPTASSDGRSELEELITSRGTSNFADAIISAQFAICSALAHTSSQLEEMTRKIDRIARRMGTIENTVNLLARKVEDVQRTVTPLPSASRSSWSPPMDWKEFADSLLKSPERTTSPDIHCDETTLSRSLRCHDLTLLSGGSTAHQE